jgi:hypothetical protein
MILHFAPDQAFSVAHLEKAVLQIVQAGERAAVKQGEARMAKAQKLFGCAEGTVR